MDRRYFPLIALLAPVVVLVLLEAALRVGGYGADSRLFVEHPVAPGGPVQGWLVASPTVARRWLALRQDVPTPIPEPFRRAKPVNGIRVFVLGESAAAGFPHGFNGSFSRVVRDALTDLFPGDTVEVINLGIAAINSHAWLDMADEVAAQRPDAILVYGGHNEFYGAFGAASTQGPRAPLWVKRGWLAMQDFRTVLLLRNGTLRMAALFKGEDAPAPLGQELALMRQMVRREEILLGDATYRRGLAEFRDNLTDLLGRFREANVPVFVASLPSNLRDQPPFRSVDLEVLPGAMTVYEMAATAFVGGDTVAAAPLFAQARDLDVLRFRASSDFNTVIREVAQESGAVYVPAEEAFSQRARGGVPGRELFAEHVHPSLEGQQLLARLFVEAIMAAGLAGREARAERLRSWSDYAGGMQLTEFDLRLAWHQTSLLKSRWPFVSRQDLRGYPWVYARRGPADSLAFDAALGRIGWVDAKVTLATAARARDDLAGARAEFAGLIRNDPTNPAPLIASGEVFLAQGDTVAAAGVLRQAYDLGAARFTAQALGRIALGQERFPEALSYLEVALPFAADPAPLLFELSRVSILMRDLPRARRYAEQLRARRPDYPGLAEWMGMLATLGGAER